MLIALRMERKREMCGGGQRWPRATHFAPVPSLTSSEVIEGGALMRMSLIGGGFVCGLPILEKSKCL